MIKVLGGLLLTMEPHLQKIIDRHTYQQIQLFTSSKLCDHYNASAKKKKSVAT